MAPLRTTDGEPVPASMAKEMTAIAGVGETISVRAAKAHLSGLLDLVASGREVVITSDGKPKAKLVPIAEKPRKVFQGSAEHLSKMPPWRGGPTAEEIIREDRDGRG